MEKSISLFKEIVDQLLQDEKENPMAEHIPSAELYDRLDLSLSNEPIDDQRFQEALTELVLKTPRTATNAFFNQLFGGRNEKAVLGDLLAVILNNSFYAENKEK